MRSATLTRTLALALGAATLLARPAGADVTGGSAKAGCYLVLKGITATKGKTKVECTDGTACDSDGTEDGKCTFAPQVCLNNPGLSPCTPTDVTAITQTGATLEVPSLPSTTASDCAPPSSVCVPVGTKRNGSAKPGKLTVTLLADSSGKPKRDKNKVKLACLPGAGGTKGGACEGPLSCPNNGDPALQNPNTVITKTLAGGSDLDNGWTGTSFNFPVIEDFETTACLSNCDKTTDPICDVKGPAGAAGPNGITLGPPLPLVANGVPVCVVNNFQTTGLNGFTGTVNLQTGESTLDIKLFSDVYLTDRTRVCPRCEAGTCSGGPNQGKPCTAHGKTRVEETFATNKVFTLSRDCPPTRDEFLARLNIALAPTTGSAGTPGTGGSRPCRENESTGVSAQDDNCSVAGDRCSIAPGNCTGPSCVSRVPDPLGGADICVDVFGGLSQNCCNISAQVPCHPTFTGGPGITRQGKPVAAATPTPWGDDQYPKTADGVILVSTFCEPPTGTSTVDLTTGLPGPGAVIFNTKATVSFVPPPAE